MIKIAVSEAAFEAIAQTPLRGCVGVEPETAERGERTIRLNRMVADRLGGMRGPGESIGDLILRIAAEGAEAPAAFSRSPAHEKAVGHTNGRGAVVDAEIKDHQAAMPHCMANAERFA